MTSTPVGDSASLLNLAGSQLTNAFSGIRSANAASFGDVMNQASANTADALKSGANGGMQNTVSQSEGSRQPEDNRGLQKTSSASERVSKSDAQSEKQTAKNVGDKDAAATEEALEKAGEELAASVAQELSVPQETVEAAMDELGLDTVDLLDGANLTKLALTISGEGSETALLTDEALYESVQNLQSELSDTLQSLSEELSVSTEELADMLKAAQGEEASRVGMQTELMTESEMQPQSKTDAFGNGEDGMNAKVSVNLNGTENAAAKETLPEESNESETETSSQNGQPEMTERGTTPKESTSGVQNTFLEQARTEVLTDTPIQETYTENAQTREIMDQILDYMKVQVKPEMDQLEMQLHPENLGTLRVQLASKGGEITAHFQVQNETVKAAMESQIAILKNTLQEQGVKVEAVEVTVESHAFESNLYQGQQQSGEELYQEKKRPRRSINLNALTDDFEETAEEEELLAASMMRANGTTVDFTA